MRLIDADDLKMVNLSICKDCLNSSEPTIYCNRCPLTDFIKTIDNAPTVDPTRRQGMWLPNYTSQFMNPGRACSLCGKIIEFSENYCPKCGAFMGGNDNG